MLAVAGIVVAGDRGGLATSLAAQSGVALNPDHPERYVVKRGDTLWDISAMFLRDPWYWPEIWQVNPQVENPHLIYPGDVLVLVYVDGQPRIQLERSAESGGTDRLSPRIRSEELDEAILTIPLTAIGPFLSKGTVLENKQIQKLPHIVAIRDNRLVAGAGNDVYVRGDVGEVNRGYSVVHIGEPLIDPDDGSTVGFQGIFVGEGTISRGGDPATLRLMQSQREALAGDRLLEQDFDIPLQFIPRAPDTDIEGRIIHVAGGVALIGQYQVVVLNRGEKHGLDVGHVLTVWQAGATVRDRTAGGMVTLPDESAGTLMVFKTYDRISYALIMEATSEMHILDKVKKPT
ncbi:MAG: LysM peptidoglycan-binding domain-containing protein [Gammaproteobacteria bacterium]|nr:LysM peptidoglycan-binding domain-containing protein [Gammaproteobacteria bacterium]